MDCSFRGAECRDHQEEKIYELPVLDKMYRFLPTLQDLECLQQVSKNFHPSGQNAHHPARVLSGSPFLKVSSRLTFFVNPLPVSILLRSACFAPLIVEVTRLGTGEGFPQPIFNLFPRKGNFSTQWSRRPSRTKSRKTSRGVLGSI